MHLLENLRDQPRCEAKTKLQSNNSDPFLDGFQPSWCVWVFAWSHRLNSPELQLPAAISLPWNVRLAHALFKSLNFYTKKAEFNTVGSILHFTKQLLSLWHQQSGMKMDERKKNFPNGVLTMMMTFLTKTPQPKCLRLWDITTAH